MKKSDASVFWTGARLGIPVILGYIPVGIAYALIARQAGFSVLETCMMSVFVYAGASEMMAAGMYAQGAGIAAIVLATFILNLRHFIMSACVMNGMRSEKRAFKELAAFGVTDEVFAIYTTQKKLERPGLVFLGMALISYLSWNLGTVIGAVASDFLPALLTAALCALAARTTGSNHGCFAVSSTNRCPTIPVAPMIPTLYFFIRFRSISIRVWG